MIATSSSHNAIKPAPAKRSLFNRPSWSKPEALASETDLFHRSNQTYVDHAAEAERQRKRKLARREKERARRTASEERSGKRQRVLESEDDEDDTSASNDSSHHSEDEKPKKTISPTKCENATRGVSLQKSNCSPKSLSKHYEATIDADKSGLDQKQKISVSHVVDLEDEEGLSETPQEEADLKIMAPKSLRPPIEDDEVVSDEEFPELARQAREIARRKRLEEDMASSTQDPLPISQRGYSHHLHAIHQTSPPPPPPDPILQIFINSSIPGTIPLIVNRKLSQRLKDVRLAWVERQHFSSAMADNVFLTWRGKRLFDVTSCRSLGISTGPTGKMMARGDNVVDGEGRIHMEAMTAEILEAYKKAKRNEISNEEEGVDQEPAVVQQKQEPQVKIICKAKGVADFKLIVKPVRISISCASGYGLWVLVYHDIKNLQRFSAAEPHRCGEGSQLDVRWREIIA